MVRRPGSTVLRYTGWRPSSSTAGLLVAGAAAVGAGAAVVAPPPPCPAGSSDPPHPPRAEAASSVSIAAILRIVFSSLRRADGQGGATTSGPAGQAATGRPGSGGDQLVKFAQLPDAAATPRLGGRHERRPPPSRQPTPPPPTVAPLDRCGPGRARAHRGR